VVTAVTFTRPYVELVLNISHHSSLIVSWTTKQHTALPPGSLESFIGSDDDDDDDDELGIEESVTGVCVEGTVPEAVLLEKERDAIGVSFLD
jgi:hypothetical protein